jgi:uracil-DNA glycosylase
MDLSLIKTDWLSIIKEILENNKEDYNTINDILKKDEYIIYPPKNLIFNAFNHFNFSDLKVVILGQDPYIKPNQAMGLSFSVNKGITLPPSLKNIFKELLSDSEINNFNETENGDLTKWVKQGVLLLNSALTTRENVSNYHLKYWEKITDDVIKYISTHNKKIIFVLWGTNARNKKKYIDVNNHYILESVHPSPLSAYRGWFGNKHFSKINKYLIENNRKSIDWCL